MLPRFVTVVLFSFIFAFSASAQTTIATPSPVPQIVSVGVGELRMPPDRAVILFSVETNGVDAAQVGRENAERISGLRRGLENFGLSPSALSTVGYSLRNEARHADRGSKELPNWFVARNGIRVTVTDLNRVGSVIDVALASGANQVEDVGFRLEAERKHRNKAVSMAVTHARAQAEAMAAAAGGKLGSLIEVSSANAPTYDGSLHMFNSAATSETAVSRTEITITERVTAKWSFVPDGIGGGGK